MAMFVHLAPEARARAIVRSGIRPSRERKPRRVFAMPVTRNFFVSHQWLRELKRKGQRTMIAVHFRIPDDELVEVGHYGGAKITVTAAEAVAVVLNAGNAEGYEVLISRAIDPREIHAVRSVRQIVGWRYYPGSHGKRPCGCPVCQPRGEIRSRKIRERYESDVR
jgi:hypothetical protein